MPNETSIMEQVLAFHDKYDFNSFTAKDVQNALNKDRIDFYDYAALLSPAALPFLEKMAEKAQLCTRKQFGNTIALFTPIYIANYCEISPRGRQHKELRTPDGKLIWKK